MKNSEKSFVIGLIAGQLVCILYIAMDINPFVEWLLVVPIVLGAYLLVRKINES